MGLRVKVRVSGALTPQLEVEDFKVDYDGSSNPFGTGDATLTYTVHNAGNTVLGGTQTAKVSAGFGGTTKSVELDRLPELLPGESWNASVPINDVHAMLWVSGGVTVTPVLTDAAGSTSTLEPITVSARVPVSAWSWVILIGTIVVLALAVWLVIFTIRRWRRASKAKVEAHVDAQVEAKVAAALREKSKL